VRRFSVKPRKNFFTVWASFEAPTVEGSADNASDLIEHKSFFIFLNHFFLNQLNACIYDYKNIVQKAAIASVFQAPRIQIRAKHIVFIYRIQTLSYRCRQQLPGCENLPFTTCLNLVLFNSSEVLTPLPRSDPRAIHLIDVLRRGVGDDFDAGLINGPRGKGTLRGITSNSLTLTFAWTERPPALDPLVLLVGLPRPQTARKILQEATALGVRAMHFFQSARGEASYGQSTLWSSGEWHRHLVTLR
jgi:hypothetical protein